MRIYDPDGIFLERFESKRYPTVMIPGRCVSINYQGSENGSRIVTSQSMPGVTATTSASGLADFSRNRSKVKAVPGTWTYKMTLGFCMFQIIFNVQI